MEAREDNNQPAPDYPPEMAELHEASRRIYELALEMDKIELGAMSRLRIETLIDREIVLVHRHLFRLARAVLLKSTGSLYDGSIPADNVDDEALDVIVPLIEKRKSTGCREIVHAICLLFGRNPGACPGDTLAYLCGAVRRAVGSARREALRQRNPIYLSVCRKVNYFVDNSERFYRRDGSVRDASVDERETEGLRPAEAEDLVSLCGSTVPFASSVAEAVVAIFDSLAAGKAACRANVPLRALQTAVYRILEPTLIDRCFCKRPLLPEEAWLVRETDRRMAETASELERDYKWRKEFDEETRTAIASAAFDYIWDKLHRDETQSQFDYLAAYLAGCMRDTYEREYKGSIQNFIKAFEERLRKKLHANG